MNPNGKGLRAGVIGVGPQMLQNLLPALRTVAGVEVVAFCDVSSAKANLAVGRSSARQYEQFSNLFDEERLDFIVCASTPAVHEAVLEHAAAKGVAAFVEKPAARSRDGLVRLIERADAVGITTGVGFNFRRCSAVESLRILLETGEFGRIESIYVRYYCKARTYSSWGLEYRRAFLLAEASHALDLICFLVSKPVLSSVHYSVRDEEAELLCTGESPQEATVSVAVRNGNTHFVFEVDVATTSGHSMRLRLPGALELSGPGIGDAVGLRGIKKLMIEPRTMETGLTVAGYLPQLVGFTSAMRNRAHYDTDIRAFLTVLEICDEICAL